MKTLHLLILDIIAGIPQLFGPLHLFDTEDYKVVFNLDQFKSNIKHCTIC